MASRSRVAEDAQCLGLPTAARPLPGLVEGRLHVPACALGASASGMTFADGLVPALPGQPLDGLLLTRAGVAEYAPSAGGMPGAAGPVCQVTPRL